MPDGHVDLGYPGPEFGVIRHGRSVPDVTELAEGDLIAIHRPGSHPGTLCVISAGTPGSRGGFPFTTELVAADA